MSELRKTVLGQRAKRSGICSGRKVGKQQFTPVKWSEYFDKEELMEIDRGSFNIYTKGNKGPILLCLHGGGYSGLTWSLFALEIVDTIECQVVAVDLRGHGNTKTSSDNDLSLATLAEDVVQIANKLSHDLNESLILIGHSMGGAVAVEASYSIDSVAGLCVIDVVEGTALDALSSMQCILRGRPSHFKSLQHAIQWCYKGGQTHNIDAARVSMPGQIVNMKTGKLAADECDTSEAQHAIELTSSHHEPIASPFTIHEIAEDDDKIVDAPTPPLPKAQKSSQSEMLPPQDDGPKYTWRIDLSKTEQFWSGWFQGLSQKFLDVRVPKVLLLANIHGLDTALTVGQMQGKFQLQVMSKSGHAIHEDQPHQVIDIISGFLVKQKLAQPLSGFVLPSMPGC